MAAVSWPVLAQEIDESYVFVDAQGNVIENGATVTCTTLEVDSSGLEVIKSGLSVKNTNGSSDYIKVYYSIEQIDNGAYQICFPTTCNSQDEVGEYETDYGQLMGDVQDLMTEWIPDDDGECIVTLYIELYSRQGLFPPTYVFKAEGPTITLHFIKGGNPRPGDVNGDGEINIADVNALIDMILSQNISESGDVNGDSEVNIADVNAVIDMILS